MSKFNFKNTNKTVNRDSFPAYKMQDKEQLVTAVLTTMFGDRRTARCDVEPYMRGRGGLLLRLSGRLVVSERRQGLYSGALRKI